MDARQIEETTGIDNAIEAGEMAVFVPGAGADQLDAMTETPARTVTAHEVTGDPAAEYEMRLSGRALVGWLSDYNGAVPGRLLTYFWDHSRNCVSAVANDTCNVWVQSVDDAVKFLTEH